MKKRIYKILTYVALTLIISSCSKDFLDTDSPKLDLDNYFVSEQKAELSLIGCYDMLGKEFDPSGSNYDMFPYFFGDIIGHDSWKGGEGPGDQAFLEPLIVFNYEPTNPGLPGPYSNYYIAINRCNRVLDNVPAMDDKIISVATKNQIVAQAKFLRGYFYFELVKMFGAVPVVTHVLDPGSYNLPRGSVDAVWAQIESDFSDASKVLPTKSEQVKGRATRGAARAFLCKAYLYQKKWADCLTLADIIEKSGEFALETNYEDNWLLSNENGIESVFEIQFKSSNTGAWGDDNEGNVFNIFSTPRIMGGWGFSYPDSSLFNKFEIGDPRLKATIIELGDTLWKGTADEYIMPDNASDLLAQDPQCHDLFAERKNLVPSSVMIEGDSPNNFKVIRYSEVLLWAAEAAVHTGGDWNYYLQQVRDRVKMGPTPIADPLMAVYHEREVELAMEGQRLWDVIRQGRGEELFGEFGYKESENHYFPIPAAEINLSKW